MPIGKSLETFKREGGEEEYSVRGNDCQLINTFITGELFDLEAVARTCQELQRWSFFVASVPLNMPGGVSSPPNMMAIF